VKEVSRKLFSSEQASDGREAHRGSVSGSEHSWAVQAPPAAPAAVGDVWFGISVSLDKGEMKRVKPARRPIQNQQSYLLVNYMRTNCLTKIKRK
jgi:hypothetical protein